MADQYGLEASGIDPEIAAQMLGLKGKRAVAQAMLEQSLGGLKQPQTPARGFTPRTSPLEAIASVLETYMNKKNLEGIDKEQAGLMTDNKRKVADALTGYEQKRAGTPSQSIPDAGPGDAVDSSTVMAGQKGDPQAAIRMALGNPLIANNPAVKMDYAAQMEANKPRVLGRTLVDGQGNTLATDSTWAAEQAAAKDAKDRARIDAQIANEEKAKQAAIDREHMLRVAASLRQPQQPVAPTMSEVVDPKDPTRMLRVDARAYKGGTLGETGVLGISGKEASSAKKAELVDSGRETVSTIVDELRGHYKILKDSGGIVDPSKGGISNAKAALSSSGLGQMVGNVVGTDNQSARNSIAQTRPLLLNAIKNATGMSAKQMDSNAELKMYLAAATDPKLDVKANENALNNLVKLYGLDGGTPSRRASDKSTVLKFDAQGNPL